MAAEVIYAPEAEQDISDAYDWYEERSPGLAEEFLRAVETCVTAIACSPKAHQVVYKTYRRGVVRRFPYIVFYEEDETRSRSTACSTLPKTPTSGANG